MYIKLFVLYSIYNNMGSVEEYTIEENKDLFSYTDKVEYFRILLTKEVFQKSSLHTMYVLIETQGWEENKESFFYKLLGRQEKLDLQNFIYHGYSLSCIQRGEDQKQHIKEHLPNLIKHFQKYYPDNHVEYISELIKKLS